MHSKSRFGINSDRQKNYSHQRSVNLLARRRFSAGLIDLAFSFKSRTYDMWAREEDIMQKNIAVTVINLNICSDDLFRFCTSVVH